MTDRQLNQLAFLFDATIQRMETTNATANAIRESRLKTARSGERDAAQARANMRKTIRERLRIEHGEIADCEAMQLILACHVEEIINPSPPPRAHVV